MDHHTSVYIVFPTIYFELMTITLTLMMPYLATKSYLNDLKSDKSGKDGYHTLG